MVMYDGVVSLLSLSQVGGNADAQVEMQKRTAKEQREPKWTTQRWWFLLLKQIVYECIHLQHQPSWILQHTLCFFFFTPLFSGVWRWGNSLAGEFWAVSFTFQTSGYHWGCSFQTWPGRAQPTKCLQPLIAYFCI